MAERRVVVAVPGPDDRAFYKAFLRWIAERDGYAFEDLDRGEHRGLKRQVLDAVAPGSVELRGTSVARLGGLLDVIVRPLGGEHGRESVAWRLLGYHLGLEEPGIRLMIVVHDMEERGARETLRGIYDSLVAGLGIVGRGGAAAGGVITDAGRYYMYVRRVDGRDVGVLLVAQGLERYQCCGIEPGRHAVEDFLLFLSGDRVRELLQGCVALRSAVAGKASHKKLAGLAAIASCRPRVDDGFVASLLSGGRVEELMHMHDGLRCLANLLRQLLTGGSMSGCG